MIYTTYFARLHRLPGDIHPIAVSNSIPGGVNIPQVKILAPDWKDIAEYKATHEWERFRKKYLDKLNSIGISAVLSLLHYNATGDIALVCYEKDACACHRSILGRWIQENAGIPVIELEKGVSFDE